MRLNNLQANRATMEIHLQFIFRNKERKASVYIDYKEEPCLIFVILKNKD